MNIIQKEVGFLKKLRERYNSGKEFRMAATEMLEDGLISEEAFSTYFDEARSRIVPPKVIAKTTEHVLKKARINPKRPVTQQPSSDPCSRGSYGRSSC